MFKCAIEQEFYSRSPVMCVKRCGKIIGVYAFYSLGAATLRLHGLGHEIHFYGQPKLLGELNQKMIPRNSTTACTCTAWCGTSSSYITRVNIRASVDLSVSIFVLKALFRASTRLCNVMGFVC
jgi:hypothetical protein